MNPPRRAKKGGKNRLETPAGSVRLVEKIARETISDPACREQFVELYRRPQPPRTALVWCRNQNPDLFSPAPSAPFQPAFVDLPAAGQRPGSNPAHAAGDYYCLDLSSVFMACPLLGLSDAEEKCTVLDLCASPGGKSIFAWRALCPGLLISNEVIGSRLPALISNLERCKIMPAAVTQLDPAWWSAEAAGIADITVVDAPCSGQSLPFRGSEALGAFHPALIGKNSMRQRRILANAAATVRPGGWLLYTTCTFSRQENEAMIEWFCGKFEEFKAEPVSGLADFKSELSPLPAYRLFPYSGFGAGGFTALLHREGAGRPLPVSLPTVRRW